MRIALMVEGQEGVSWEEWLALAEACEAHGIEAMFRSDHYSSQTDTNRLATDAWTLLGALAARTSTLRFGTLVSPVTFRHPSVVARAAATVDHVSGGRVEVGMGAGWMELEHERFSFPFPPVGERVAMLAEHLEAVDRLLREDPLVVQEPRPPLIVGGAARRGTAEPAARFADEYNTTGADPAEARPRRASGGGAARVRGRGCRARDAPARRPPRLGRRRRARRAGCGRRLGGALLGELFEALADVLGSAEVVEPRQDRQAFEPEDALEDDAAASFREPLSEQAERHLDPLGVVRRRFGELGHRQRLGGDDQQRLQRAGKTVERVGCD